MKAIETKQKKRRDREATMRIGGGLALACSGVDMVALVEITKRAN